LILEGGIGRYSRNVGFKPLYAAEQPRRLKNSDGRTFEKALRPAAVLFFRKHFFEVMVNVHVRWLLE
jgi:hypothetical protein